MSGWPNFLL